LSSRDRGVIAILGAGAIGGFLGARLARAGADVVLIARGPHLQAMKESGLRVIDKEGEWNVLVNATDDFAAIRDAQAVFVALKAHSLPPVADQLASNLGDETAVVSAQNGIPWWYFQRHGGELEGIHLETVDPGGHIARAIDPRRVIGCIVYPSTSLVSPGVIMHTEGERFSLGELDGAHTARAAALSDVLGSAGLKAPVQTNIRSELWLKLLGNAVFNPLSVLTRATLGEVAGSPMVAGVVRAAMEEVESVASRLGIEVPISLDRRIKGAARVGDHKTSMLQDLEAGRPMEIDALTGSVVELGDRFGIPVPHLRTLYSAVKLLQATAPASIR
jgi:2-dehydropantoate 2-reductase